MLAALLLIGGIQAGVALMVRLAPPCLRCAASRTGCTAQRPGTEPACRQAMASGATPATVKVVRVLSLAAAQAGRGGRAALSVKSDRPA
ncbi:hypothetical protein [Chitinimonas sp.]|uniref:hypothetical protein n=1 Tax=Chitinimonas sp. TaxID=1934313 RepID=UPI0035AF034F